MRIVSSRRLHQPAGWCSSCTQIHPISRHAHINAPECKELSEVVWWSDFLSGARPQGAVALQTRTPPHGRGDLVAVAFDLGGASAVLVLDEGDAPSYAHRDLAPNTSQAPLRLGRGHFRKPRVSCRSELHAAMECNREPSCK